MSAHRLEPSGEKNYQLNTTHVVAAPGSDPEGLKAAIRTACRAQLARHKVPTRVVFVERVAGERGKKVRT